LVAIKVKIDFKLQNYLLWAWTVTLKAATFIASAPKVLHDLTPIKTNPFISVLMASSNYLSGYSRASESNPVS
jgi:hypothetical protein